MTEYAIVTAGTPITPGRHNCAAVYPGARVVQNGRRPRRTVAEPNAVVENGRIVTLS